MKISDFNITLILMHLTRKVFCNYMYSRTSLIMPPLGLDISGPISEVAKLERFIYMHILINGLVIGVYIIELA